MSQNRTEKVKQVPDFKKMQEKFQQKIERGKEEKKKTVTVVKEFNFSSRPTKKETSEPCIYFSFLFFFLNHLSFNFYL